MEITRDALLRIVKATRTTMRLADGISEVLTRNGFTVVDDVVGFLQDALYTISNEKERNGEKAEDNFDDSMTMRLLKSDMDDKSVTDWFFMMESINTKINAIKPQDIQLPPPQIMSKEDMSELYKKNGGYMSPEGEWTK